MTVAALILVILGQDLGKYKEQLRSSVLRGTCDQAQIAIDGLASLGTEAAVDALIESAGACRKEEMAGLERYKDLLDRDRKTFDDLQKKQDKYRAASQEYSRARTPENQKKLQETQREMRPAGEEYDKAHKAYEEFAVRYRAVSQIRHAAIDALCRIGGEAGIKRLIERFKNTAEWTIRAGIASALEHIPTDEALKVLLEQLKKEKEPTVKVAILDALTTKKAKSPEVLQAIMDVLRSADAWQVHFAALQAVKALNAREAVEAVIDGMSRAEGRLQADFQEALIALTGVDKGILPDAWKAWWTQNKEAVIAGTYEPRPEEKAKKAAGATTFFGIPVVSKRVVFVLDRSGSMSMPADFELPIESGGGDKLPPDLARPKGTRKIDVARWQLKKVLHQLPEGTLFNVIFYGTNFEVYKPHLVALNPGIRQEVFAYIDTLEPSGGTNIFDSIERALAFALGEDGKLKKEGVDTIYLLSDGMPNQGRFKRPDEVRAEIKKLNDNLKVALHAVLIAAMTSAPQNPQPGQPQPRPRTTSNGDEAFMKGLADENFGEFRSMRPAGSAPRRMESR